MTVRDYVEKVLKLDKHSCEHFTFVIQEVMHPELHTRYWVSHNTPMRCWYEYKGTHYSEPKEADILDYIVLNEKQPVTYWLSGANWNHAIMKGYDHSLLVVSREELLKYFGGEEGLAKNDHFIEFIDNEILKAHGMTREDLA